MSNFIPGKLTPPTKPVKPRAPTRIRIPLNFNDAMEWEAATTPDCLKFVQRFIPKSLAAKLLVRRTAAKWSLYHRWYVSRVNNAASSLNESH